MFSGATLVDDYTQFSTLPGSITVYMVSGATFVGFTHRSVLSLDPSLCTYWVVRPWWVLHTAQYSPWIHHCVHGEWCDLGGFYTQISTLPGSITVYMVSGVTLVGFTHRSVLSLDPSLCTWWVVQPWWVLHTAQYSPWIHHCVHGEWCDLGGFYTQISTLSGSITVYMVRGATLVGFTHSSVLSLDPSLCTWWVVRPWWVLHTAQYSPWIHYCVHGEWCDLGGFYTQISTVYGPITVYMVSGETLVGFTHRSVLFLDPSLCTWWVMRPWWVLHTDQFSSWIHHCVHGEWRDLGGFLYRLLRTEWFVVIKAERSARVDQSERFCVR